MAGCIKLGNLLIPDRTQEPLAALGGKGVMAPQAFASAPSAARSSERTSWRRRGSELRRNKGSPVADGERGGSIEASTGADKRLDSLAGGYPEENI
jgi:hypothetical protein